MHCCSSHWEEQRIEEEQYKFIYFFPQNNAHSRILPNKDGFVSKVLPHTDWWATANVFPQEPVLMTEGLVRWCAYFGWPAPPQAPLLGHGPFEM